MQECAQESVAAQKYPALVFAGARKKKKMHETIRCTVRMCNGSKDANTFALWRATDALEIRDGACRICLQFLNDTTFTL